MQESQLQQVGLVHVHHGVRLLRHRRRQRLQTHRPAAEALDQRAQQRPVAVVEAQAVDAQPGQRRVGHAGVDRAVAAHLRVVAHAAQQAVGDAGRAARAPRQQHGPVVADRDRQLGRVRVHQSHEVGGLVELQPLHHPEAVAQRGADQRVARRRAHQCEALDLQPHAARPRPLADQQVQREVLHGRVEHLLDGVGQAVHLIDEEHVAVLQRRQQAGQVAGPRDGRPRRGAQVDAHLRRDDARQRRLAQPRAGRRTADGRAARRAAAPRSARS